MGFYQNRIMPHLLNLAMRTAEHEPYRQRVLSQAEGRVLEIGVGSGLNLPFYTDRATEILGLEPHPSLLAMAARKSAIIPAKLIGGSAESIPLDDATVDTVVTTWTLCSIPNPARALEEMRRVLKPGGQLLFVEHGLAREERVRRWQRRLNPVWKRIAGGCNLDRPISKLLEDAGFRIGRVETGYMRGPKTVNFTYEGCARPG
jgi:ubiquinone/menaquinone biosynthesis C-methylase UbiE